MANEQKWEQGVGFWWLGSNQRGERVIEYKAPPNRPVQLSAETLRKFLAEIEVSATATKTQKTQPQGIDPETGKPYEPVEIPVPKRQDVDDALDRLIEAEPDRD